MPRRPGLGAANHRRWPQLSGAFAGAADASVHHGGDDTKQLKFAPVANSLCRRFDELEAADPTIAEAMAVAPNQAARHV